MHEYMLDLKRCQRQRWGIVRVYADEYRLIIEVLFDTETSSVQEGSCTACFKRYSSTLSDPGPAMNTYNLANPVGKKKCRKLVESYTVTFTPHNPSTSFSLSGKQIRITSLQAEHFFVLASLTLAATYVDALTTV